MPEVYETVPWRATSGFVGRILLRTRQIAGIAMVICVLWRRENANTTDLVWIHSNFTGFDRGQDLSRYQSR
jgi:hypothetical protein